MNNKTLSKIYNLAICVFAIISVILSVLDLQRGLNGTERIIDSIIYFLFVIDYLVRFFLSKRKTDFVKSNIPDLIAIIPFNSAFRIFRLFRFIKAARFARLFKIGSLSLRGINKAKRFFNTNGFKYVLCVSAVVILLSAVSMTYFERMSFQDALWWSFVTATTVGYGDLSPATGTGRIIAALLMLVGIGLIGSLTSTITTFFLSGDETSASDEQTEADNTKIKMCLILYEQLNSKEKEEFKNQIK